MPAAFVDDWYNGREERVSEYIGNKRSILVGMPRLRQLRVKQSKYIIYNKEIIVVEFLAEILLSEIHFSEKVTTKLIEDRIHTHQNLNDF